MRENFTELWQRDGAPLCTLRCMTPAELTIDGVPYCVGCADLLIEREVAVSLAPELVALLPPLTYGREAYETFRASRRQVENAPSRSAEPDAWAKLDALRAEAVAAGRAGRPAADAPKERIGVTPDEPHEPEGVEPAGQLSLLADA